MEKKAFWSLNIQYSVFHLLIVNNTVLDVFFDDIVVAEMRSDRLCFALSLVDELSI